MTTGLRASIPVEEVTFKEKFYGVLSDIQKSIADAIDRFNEYVCRSMAKRPLTHFCAYWGIMMLIMVIILAGGYLELSQVQLVDFMIPSIKDVQNDFALSAAEREVDESGDFIVDINFRGTRAPVFSLFFLYESTDGNSILTLDNIKVMCELENQLVEDELFPFFCFTENGAEGADTVCDNGVSLPGFIYRNIGRDCDSLDQATLDAELNILVTNAVDLSNRILNDGLDSTIVKTTIFLGGPLGSDTDPPGEDFKIVEEVFLSDQGELGYERMTTAFRDNLFEFLGLSNTAFNRGFASKTFDNPNGATFSARVHGFHLEFLEFQSVVTVDSLISGGSFMVVTLLVFLYTGSCFFACLSMIAVAMSVFMGLFLYATVCQIDYFNNLHIVVLFIILAIGANNIFVIVDAWRQSEAVILEEIEVEKLRGINPEEDKVKEEDLSRIELDTDNKKADEDEVEAEYVVSEAEILRRRLTYAYGRASLSVANTAMTTFLAFVATAVSDLAPIAAFGIYAGLVILVNLIYMLNIHPATLMVYHVYIQGGRKLDEDNAKSVGEKDAAPKQKCIHRMFDIYIYYINNTKLPIVALLITVSYGIMMTAFAFQLETPSSIESNYNDNHMFTGFQEDFNGVFGDAADNEEILTRAEAVFGIEALDAAGVPKFTTSEFRGDVVYNPDFEIYSFAAQKFLVDFCDALEVESCNGLEGCVAGETLIKPDTLNCWIRDYHTWFANENKSATGLFFATTFENGSDSGTTQAQVYQLISEFVTEDEDAVRRGLAADVGSVNNDILFTKFRYRKTMQEDQPLGIKQPVIALMDSFSDRFIDEAIERDLPGMDTLFQTSFDYLWQHTEEALVSGLYSGMAVSLSASFLVILSGTKNFVVSVYAIMGVGAIVMCVLGTVYTFGWELGTAEALAGVMVIGLAVDYTVHLGHMFIHSRKYLAEHDIGDLKKENDKTHNSRIVQSLIEEKEEGVPYEPNTVFYNADMVHYAVDRMGVTILAGALTTFCSGIFLLLCSLSFFTKMAVLIVLTVVYSTLFAFFFFVPMLRLFGPGVRDKQFHEKVAKEGGAQVISV